MGEATRKEKVIPSGTPASTKPRKRGTALQEQNGAMMPKEEAKRCPVSRPRPKGSRRILLGGQVGTQDGHREDDGIEGAEDLEGVENEESDRAARGGSSAQREKVESKPVGKKLERQENVLGWELKDVKLRHAYYIS